MKNLFAGVLALIIFLSTSSVFASPISSDGYFNGIRLWGKVRVVTAFPDSLGKLQFVSGGEDFTIQYVDAFPDIKIKFVDAFPGF